MGAEVNLADVVDQSFSGSDRVSGPVFFAGVARSNLDTLHDYARVLRSEIRYSWI